MRYLFCVAIGFAVLAVLAQPPRVFCTGPADERFPFFARLTATTPVTLITYTPSELDPRNPANQRKLATTSIHADLQALRPHFDGLVLYGYHEACTPRIAAIAKELKFSVLVLAVWDPRSAQEIDGVAELARLHEKDFALAVLVGNEGITFKRYEPADLAIAATRLRSKLAKNVPISTSEPLVGYNNKVVLEFGDFLAPNIHPVFDRPDFDAAKGAAWARQEAVTLARKTQKPVILKETGFPHDGKAAYTLTTQKDFWAAYLKPGLIERPDKSARGYAYFGIAFDAFDLGWKAQESKLPIEKSWGLFSEKRQPYPALAVWQNTRKTSAK